jgi:hypothetical protein
MAPDPDSPTVVAADLKADVATAFVNHLESLGIAAHIWGEDLLPRSGFKVVVRHKDSVRAKKAIDELRRKKEQRSQEHPGQNNAG